MPYDDLEMFTTVGCLSIRFLHQFFGLEQRSWELLVLEMGCRLVRLQILVWDWCLRGHKFWFGLVTNFGLGLVSSWSQFLVWDTGHNLVFTDFDFSFFTIRRGMGQGGAARGKWISPRLS